MEAAEGVITTTTTQQGHQRGRKEKIGWKEAQPVSPPHPERCYQQSKYWRGLMWAWVSSFFLGFM